MYGFDNLLATHSDTTFVWMVFASRSVSQVYFSVEARAYMDPITCWQSIQIPTLSEWFLIQDIPKTGVGQQIRVCANLMTYWQPIRYPLCLMHFQTGQTSSSSFEMEKNAGKVMDGLDNLSSIRYPLCLMHFQVSQTIYCYCYFEGNCWWGHGWPW